MLLIPRFCPLEKKGDLTLVNVWQFEYDQEYPQGCP